MTKKNRIEIEPKIFAWIALTAGLALIIMAGPGNFLPSCQASAAPPSDSETSASAHGELVVTVNGTAITKAEVDQELIAGLGLPTENLPEGALQSIRAEMVPRVTDMLITRELLKQAADAEQIPISESDIAEVMERLTSALPPGASLEDMKAQLGVSDSDWNSQLEQDLRIQRLVEVQVSDVTAPTAEEIETFFNDHAPDFQMPETARVSHILVSLNEDDSDVVRAEKRQKAESLHERLTGDEPELFEDVAAQISDCPSRSRGGDLGELARGQTVPAFDEAAFTQEPGVIGPIVETEFGFHIIRVASRNESRILPLNDAREFISRHLLEERQQEVLDRYIETLKSKASIAYATT